MALTSLDHVRLLVPDDVVAEQQFSDSDINDLLDLQVTNFGRPVGCAAYFVAAELVLVLVSKFGQVGKGVNVKHVGKLKVEFGGRQQTLAELQTRADKLLADGRRCARRTRTNQPGFFHAAGRVVPEGTPVV